MRVPQLQDRIYKNVMRKQNLFKIVEDTSKFDSQNPITGSLLSEVESGELNDDSIKKLLNNAQSQKDIALNQKLQNLKSFNNNLQLNNNNDSDNENDYTITTIPSTSSTACF